MHFVDSKFENILRFKVKIIIDTYIFYATDDLTTNE